MAKSFKQLPSDSTQPAKRTSEKDILDFLEQDWLAPSATASAPSPATAPSQLAGDESTTIATGHNNTGNTKAKGPLSNTVNVSNTNNTSNISGSSSNKKTTRQERKASASNKLQESITNATRSMPVANETSVNDVIDEHAKHNFDDIAECDVDVDVRQTFVLGQQHLEKLKNYVHTQRISGQYDFTQKQALHQALDLLFATARIEERPQQIRQKEEVRRQQIRRGKLK